MQIVLVLLCGDFCLCPNRAKMNVLLLSIFALNGTVSQLVWSPLWSLQILLAGVRNEPHMFSVCDGRNRLTSVTSTSYLAPPSGRVLSCVQFLVLWPKFCELSTFPSTSAAVCVKCCYGHACCTAVKHAQLFRLQILVLTPLKFGNFGRRSC